MSRPLLLLGNWRTRDTIDACLGDTCKQVGAQATRRCSERCR